MNKKSIVALFLALLVCGSFAGCDIRTPDYAINVGTEQQIVGNDSLKVVSAELSDGIITVTLDLNFETITLSDFEYITVKKSEDGAPEIKYDLSESRKQNEGEVFDAPRQGEVTLVFRGDSISSEDDLSTYLLHMGYCREDGTMPHGDFLLA